MRTSLFCLLLASAAFSAEMRPWTDAQGNQTQAVLRGFDGGEVLLQNAAGKTLRVPIKNLSADDQSYVVLNITTLVDPSFAAPKVAPAAVGPILTKSSWPATLTAPDGLTNADYVEQKSKPGSHLYRSRRFEYVLNAQEKLNPVVMKEVARVFEGTYEMLSQSPFGVQAQPVDGYFRAQLYQTMQLYHAAGGPMGSGGVYKRDERVFKVPLESLGLKLGTNGYVRDDNFELKTLVHEITHMMMHDILPLLPRWLIEGSAEYVECIPYKSGTFRHSDLLASVRRYNKDRLSGKYRFSGPPLDELQRIIQVPIVRKAGNVYFDWEMPGDGVPMVGFYHSAMLMTYYFMHLDGDGKGTRLLKFLEAVRAEQPKHTAFVKEFEAYRVAMEEFSKKPEVKKLPDGRIEFPSYLKPPPEPTPPHPDYRTERLGYIHIGLLFDGRKEEDLAREAIEALRKVGLEAAR
ncbi:MAG: hypothetical protein IPK22_02790 [Verrucomicrobiaceae bacterium]|nr:hypothetical protein [Verrucomicrobiaceae bacterium]